MVALPPHRGHKVSARPRPVPAPSTDSATGRKESPADTHQSSTPELPVGMVEVHGVSKFFGDVVAVSEVTFAVRSGVTALLGPNGAGKSTLFRMMCGLTAPSRGSVTVLGADARSDRDVRGRIGLSPQQDALFDRLGALDFVRIAAETQGVIDPVEAARRTLNLVELNPDDPRPISGYSKGMRQRTKLAAALVHDPDVLILDEPLNGLDPLQRRRMIEMLAGLGAQGRCVLVSSHVLSEVALLGSRILVIAQGRLVASGDYRELRELMDDRPHRVSIETDNSRTLAAALVESGVAVGVRVEGDAVVADTLDVDRLGREIAPLARRLDSRLRSVLPLDEDLESVFRYLVERR